ncbi:MAG: GtrA family protein, partial [Rhodococcus sp.]|nr:GtrA family protein [Rhodococcus sp. (in: high G+C Gram-positive bacteria)]
MATVNEPQDPPVTPPAGMSGRPGPLMRVVKNQGLAFVLVGGFNTALGTLWFIAWQLALG